MVSAEKYQNLVSWYTSGDKKTGYTALEIWFLVLRPCWCIFWRMLGFVKRFLFQTLALGWFPFLVANHQGCAVAQTRSLSVPYSPQMSFLARGVHVILPKGLTPRTLHLHWSINVIQSGSISSDIQRSWGVLVSVSLWGISWLCLFSPSFFLVIKMGSMAGSSCGKNRLIYWIDRCSLIRWHWYIFLNSWLDELWLSILLLLTVGWCG